MRKILLILLLFNTFLFSQSILIINSYHKGYAWSDEIISGIEKVFYKNENIETTILYMDSKRITSKEYHDSLKKLYEIQLENSEFDLIITIDDHAHKLALEIYNDSFRNKPILAVGIDEFNKNRLSFYNAENKVSALLEKKDLEGNLRLIEILMPSIKKVYIISDNTLNNKRTEPFIKNLFTNFHYRYEIEHLKADTLVNLEALFLRTEENAAILFVGSLTNQDTTTHKSYEIAEFIKHAKVPVFVTDSIYMNKGATGGKIINLEKLGEEAALMAQDIIHGSGARVSIYDSYEYIFDSRKLLEFTIAVAKHLPFKYEIINKKEKFYDKHRVLISFVFSTSPFLVLLILGLIHNIYFRKKVEKSLRHRVEFDDLLLNTIKSPIFWQNEKEIILEVNRSFCSFIGLEYNQIVGKKLEEIDSLNARKLWLFFRENKKIDEANVSFVYKNEKNKRSVNIINQARFYDEKYNTSGTVILFTDITEKRRIERQRQKEQQYIMQQSKLAEIGEIFSSIAHQWKAPLVEITTIAQESFYLSEKSTMNEKESYVKDLMTQVDYMNDTINNFQQFIMPSNKKTTFDVHEAIKDILNIAEHNIKYNYIDLSVNVKENTNLLVLGYKNEFMQAFLNIINNAKDEFIKRKLQNKKIDVNIFNKKNYLIIKIEDNAGGIKIRKIQKVFQQYFTTKEDGHGIGLYMTKLIIEDKMNGRITVKNTNEGACFTIILGQKL